MMSENKVIASWARLMTCIELLGLLFGTPFSKARSLKIQTLMFTMLCRCIRYWWYECARGFGEEACKRWSCTGATGGPGFWLRDKNQEEKTWKKTHLNCWRGINPYASLVFLLLKFGSLLVVIPFPVYLCKIVRRVYPRYLWTVFLLGLFYIFSHIVLKYYIKHICALEIWMLLVLMLGCNYFCAGGWGQW